MEGNTHIAIAPDKTVHEFSEVGLSNLKRLHEDTNVKGWLYGTAAEKETLLAQVVTVDDAKHLAEENAKMKALLKEKGISMDGKVVKK